MASGTIGLVLLLLLSACATAPRFDVDVNSITSDNKPSGRTYVLLPINDDIDPSSLQFQEYAKYVEVSLSEQEFSRVQVSQSPDLVILMGYGIGDSQQEIRSYSLPMWGQTGIASSSTYGTLNTYGNYSSYSGTTTYNPSYGITGYTTHLRSETTYLRHVVLLAFDMNKEDNESRLWEAVVTSRGSSNDLRQVFPIMVVALKPYIWKNTGQAISVNLSEDDKAVTDLRTMAGYSPPK